MEYIFNHINLSGQGQPKPDTTVVTADSVTDALDQLHDLKPQTIQITSINGENFSELI